MVLKMHQNWVEVHSTKVREFANQRRIVSEIITVAVENLTSLIPLSTLTSRQSTRGKCLKAPLIQRVIITEEDVPEGIT